MIKRHLRWVVVVAIVATGFAVTPVARGATCKVPSTAYPTINSATADANCTVIKLGSGPFYENVTVPNPGVTIVGKGGECGEKPQSIIDASPLGVDATGTHVQADNVTIKNLVIRHGTAGIDTDADNTKVINTCIFGSRGGEDATGVRMDGDSATVKNSEFHSSDGPALRVRALASGTTTFTGNYAHNIGHHCVWAHGGTVTVSDNKLRGCDDQGVRTENKAHATIDDNVITNVERGIEHTCCGHVTARRNKITNAQDKGIQADGDGTRIVSKNTVVSSRHRCIQSEGQGATEVTSNVCGATGGIKVRTDIDPIVNKNRVELAWEDHGFRVECDATCTGAQIVGNFVGGANRDHNGFEISANGNTGGLIADNISQFSGNNGFLLRDLNDWTIENNQALSSGQREGSNDRNGIRLDNVDNSLVIANVSRDGRDDGFHLTNDSDLNQLHDNQAVNNVKDGFHVTPGSDANTFELNIAKGNQAEGIENDATNTLLTDNISKKNRWDCNWFDGTEDVSSSGTTCADGLDPNTLPPQGQID